MFVSSREWERAAEAAHAEASKLRNQLEGAESAARAAAAAASASLARAEHAAEERIREVKAEARFTLQHHSPLIPPSYLGNGSGTGSGGRGGEGLEPGRVGG